MADTVKVSLGLVVDGFNVALKAAQSQTESFSKNAVSNFQLVEKSFAVMAGTLAANAFEKITSSIKDGFDHVIEEAGLSEEAINKLNIALKSAGLYSKSTSEELQEYAASLQKTSIYSDEAILKSTSLFLSLTNLDKNGIKEATKAAINLAATLGIELSEASDMIEKAVKGNTIAFHRKGIAIQSADTDAQRLTNTLKALATQEGAAEAATNTYAGAIAKQKNQHSEVLEALGKLITQNKIVKDSIDASTASYAAAAEWIIKNKKFIDDLTSTIIITTGVVAASAVAYYAVTAAIGVLGIAAATGTTAFGALGIAAGLAWAAITAPITIIVGAIALVGIAIYELVKHWDEVKAATYNALAATIEFAAKGVEVFSSAKAKALKDQAQAWRDKAATIREASAAAAENEKVDASQVEARQKKLQEEADNVARIYKNKAEARRINNEQLLAIDQDSNLAIQEAEVTHLQAMAEINGEADANSIAAAQEAQAELRANRQIHEQEMLQLSIDAEINKANLETDAKKRTDELRAINDKANVERAKLNAKQEVDTEKAKNKDLETLRKKELDDRANTLTLFASLQRSNNQVMARIGQAAALTQIAIDTPKAASSAFAYGSAIGGPPVGFTFQAIAYAAEAAMAAQVLGVNFASGGIVPGSDISGDRVRANLNSREMVLNQQQQAQLFNIANGAVPQASGGSSISREDLFAAVDAISNRPISVQIDGREVINVIRSQTSSGRSFS